MATLGKMQVLDIFDEIAEELETMREEFEEIAEEEIPDKFESSLQDSLRYLQKVRMLLS